MPATTSPPAAVAATQRVASWLTHMGVSTHAFDDTLGLINPLLTVHRLHAKITGKQQETPSTCTLVLQAGPAFTGLTPGQYVIVGVTINGVRYRRAYSPRAIDGRVDQFAITVQRQPDGRVSNHIHDHLQVGDIIEIEAAAGDFTLPSPLPSEVLMMAGGSGITPCMSMIEHLRRSASNTRVTLIYFARSQADRIFAKTLDALASQWSNLRYVPLESVANTAGNAAGPQAMLDVALLDQQAPGWRNLPAWCCGPAPLMDAAREIWKDAGIATRLKLEAFAPARPSGDPSVRHHIEIARDGAALQFDAPGNETLLVSGETAGFALKHGCRQGICHECTCRLHSGSIKDLVTGERIDGDGQPVRLCVSAALSDLKLEALG